jgi:UDP-N-acetylmuramate dehydrogenase
MTPQSDVALAPLCTMAVGGAARWFVDAHRESDVADALHWAHQRAVAVHVLGGGSNVLVADEGIDGLVIHISMRGVERVDSDGLTLYSCAAGEPWDPFVAATVQAGCAGLECLSGIPGGVGGTPVQNVGAYGQDVSGTITRVRVVTRASGAAHWLHNTECGFGYRTSRFKRDDNNKYIVTAVEFELRHGSPPTIQYADVIAYFETAGRAHPTLQEVRDAVLAIRRRKGMVIEPGNEANRSCGSFFVNPIVTNDDLRRVESITGGTAVPHYVVDAASVKIPAAWLIERAGFPKGTKRSTVAVSPFQAQAIINLGGARAADVLALASDMKRAVWTIFGISIVPEPVFLGFAPSSELRFLLTEQRSH